jgi:ribosomal protein S18 acetylase RimI-like enzyme
LLANNVQFKKVGVQEAPLLLDISKKTFFDAFLHLNNAADMAAYARVNFTIDKIESELGNAHSDFYFAYVDEQLAGYMKLNFADAQTEFQDAMALEIERVYVIASYQGKNIGGQMIAFAVDVARQHHFDYVWLGVWEKNLGAIRFYERHGFNLFGSHEFMLGDDRQIDVLMKLPLT